MGGFTLSTHANFMSALLSEGAQSLFWLHLPLVALAAAHLPVNNREFEV